MRAASTITDILWSVRSCIVRALFYGLLLAAIPPGVGSRTERVNLFPKLQAGQTITYQIRFRADKDIKTQSTVALPLAPGGTQIDVQGLLRMNVMDVRNEGGKGVIHLQTLLETRNSDTDLKIPEIEPPRENLQRTDSKGKIVEFTIAADGRMAGANGLDALLPEQQQAWGEWVSLFAMAAAFPGKDVKRGEKWQSDEAEKSPAPIAGLVWRKKSTYVRDEPCRPAQLTAEDGPPRTDQVPETCAVILTTATLKQKSSRKNATPEDYKLHDLQTMGTARGANQVIAYISLKTGLVVRATEEASQSMDVVVAKRGGTNRVHYSVGAKSNSEVLLVADKPLVGH
jgi:hypothetical protein